MESQAQRIVSSCARAAVREYLRRLVGAAPREVMVEAWAISPFGTPSSTLSTGST